MEEAKLANRMLTSITVARRSLPNVAKFHFFDLYFVLISGLFAIISYAWLSPRRLWLK